MANKTHGMRPKGPKSRTYNIWQSMRRRCYDQGREDYHHYGGRGITACQRWLGRDGFPNFVADMGEAPDGMTLDRKRNSEGYSPENCRWATQKEQQRNRRSNHLIEFRGKTLTIAGWCDELGMKKWTIVNRLRYGWSIERIFTTPVDTMKRKKGYGVQL